MASVLRASFFLAALALVSGSAVSPIQKVIELLQDNKMKVGKDLAAEGKEMEEYAEFCDDESKDKGYAIKTATRSMADLTAAIEDGTSQIDAMNGEVKDLGSTMAEKERELMAATELRNTEKATFRATEKELVNSVDALDKAIVQVKRSASLVQTNGVSKPRYEEMLKAIGSILSAAWVDSESKTKLQGLMQTEESEDDGELSLTAQNQAAQTKVFQSSGGGILGYIEDMSEKADETLSGARATEMRANHNFQMVEQSLGDAIQIAKDKLAATKSAIEKARQGNGQAKGQLRETSDTKKADEDYLNNLKQECMAAASNWEERQRTAREEMAVIEKAKQLLASKADVSSLAQKFDPDTLADSSDSSDSDNSAGKRGEVEAKLKELSHEYNSYALMDLVSKAASDPFEKIRGLIGDMVAKLESEAAEEATQKAFCDEEMGKSNKAKDTKSMRADKLQSRMDTAATTKATLEDNIKDLSEEVAALDKGEAEATKLRQEERATYKVASSEFKGAVDAIAGAVTMLKEYYKGGSLMQTQKGAAKQPEFKSAKDNADASGVIVAILENSGEDFSRLYMETEQNEREAVKSFETLQKENKVSRAAKSAEIKGMKSEIRSLEVVGKNAQSDFSMTSKELDAVLMYIDKLRPQCETKVMSFAEKKARREAEIAGLKEALSILDGPSLMQAPKRQLRAAKHA